MKVAVLGLGVDSQDVIPYLKKRGDQVTILDEAKGDKFQNLEKFDLIIRSPGVYRFRPEIVAAEKAGVEISSKTKLFFDLCPAKIIGVTGTKGKGTTATLIYEILKAAGKKVFLGGNIGAGLFESLEKLDTDSLVVFELSSFQLIDLHKSPHIGVVLMVTSEHLDWHASVEEYLESKKNIARHQTTDDFIVINQDYANSLVVGEHAVGQKYFFSRQGEVFRGTFLEKDSIVFRQEDDEETVVQRQEIRLRGEHNLENIMAAITVARLLKIETKTIKTTIASFGGLEHRLEEVATVNGASFFNDSFSTTPETAIAAIKAFFEPEILILGGSSKNSDFTQLGKVVAKAKNIKAVILIGVEGPRIKEQILKHLRDKRKIKLLEGAKNMAEIVKIAYNNAVAGDVVLLSPACASFDMFKNYKQRGDKFKEEIRKLK